MEAVSVRGGVSGIGWCTISRPPHMEMLSDENYSDRIRGVPGCIERTWDIAPSLSDTWSDKALADIGCSTFRLSRSQYVRIPGSDCFVPRSRWAVPQTGPSRLCAVRLGLHFSPTANETFNYERTCPGTRNEHHSSVEALWQLSNQPKHTPSDIDTDSHSPEGCAILRDKAVSLHPDKTVGWPSSILTLG